VPDPLMDAPAAATARPSAAYATLAALGGLVALAMLVRLAVFASHPEPAPGWSVAPWSPFMTRHACSTAYWSAATRITETPDVWDIRGYTLGQDPASGRLIPRTVGPFAIDPYEYPPTFLLAPRALAAVAPDFVTFRRVWLILNAVFVVGGMALVGRHLDATTGRPTLWLLPLAIVPLTTMYALQMGNAQLLYLVGAMLGMTAFARGRHAIGGLLLAFAIVGKIFPAVLVLYLGLRRDWRALGWTSAWAGVLVIATLADVGWAPFPFFLDHLPRLLSGEAFPMLRAAITAANNMSVPGLVLKPQAFGGPSVPFEALKYAGWIYSVVVIGAVAWLARRPVAARYEPLAWLAVLGLTAFRSPFLPTYGVFPGAWLAAILLAVCWNDTRRWWIVLALWALLLPTTAGPTPLPLWAVATFTTVQSAAALGLIAVAIRIGHGAGDARTGAVQA
jgi:hypothetical protein